MKKNVTTITIMVMAMIIMIVSVAGCNTSCNKDTRYTLVPTETEVTEVTDVTDETMESVTGTTITTVTNVTTTTEATVTTTTDETVETVETNETTAAPTATPKPNYTNGDINFGNDESAASEYQGNNGGTVETTTPPTNKPEPTATPTPEPTATPTPEPTEAPKETTPDTGYAIVKVKVTTTVYDNDETTDTHNEVDYFEVEGWTSNYHSTSASDYNCKSVSGLVNNKYGAENVQGYSAKIVEVVRFTN